ncbi:TGB3 [Robigovirus elaeis]|uniref:Movement protein TGBp3 n=1 Tax=Robigovirus elaeis TaxID=185218 RepID=C1BEG1_9VIRU|nr:TGB3 [African oil palm ringspot virus]ACO38638.1 TGB3 [African oil palm ringspot virus]
MSPEVALLVVVIFTIATVIFTELFSSRGALGSQKGCYILVTGERALVSGCELNKHTLEIVRSLKPARHF